MPPEPASTATARAPRKGRKYFNLAEANRALPYVERVVHDIDTDYRGAMEIRRRLERPHPEDTPESLRADYERIMDRLNDLVDELKLVGVDLKDFEIGLVDFPAIHEGREVCLCWKRGESRITAWHELEAGYAGRQDVALLEP